MPRSLQERLKALQRSVQGSEVDSSAESENIDPKTDSSYDKAKATGELSDGDTTNRSSYRSRVPSELGFEEVDDGFGPYWLRVLRFDLLARHGNRRFVDIHRAKLESLGKASKLGPDIQIDAQKLRFYDTETTGLGSGAGTFPFLYAMGQLEQDDFVVYQYFLQDYTQEPALLRSLVNRHLGTGDEVLVTFNGKSFDWPLTTTRGILHRVDVPTHPSHIDLLHPARRLWRETMHRVSLTSLESAIMGLDRVDDLPGREAPARYFAYVTDGLAAPLQPVLDHNASDVCALVSLSCILADVLSGLVPIHNASTFTALGRWYDEWGDHDLAESCYAAAANCPDATWRTFWLQSLRYKRQGRFADAKEIWRDMAVKYPWTVPPLVELAKVAEHREGDLELAAKAASEAIRRALHQQADGETLLVLRHRLQRIQKKQGR